MPQLKRQTKRPVAMPDTPVPTARAGVEARPGLLAVVGRLTAFIFAGGIGFVVDMLGTLTLINFGLHPYLARAIAIAAALLATFAINRGVTFRAKASPTGRGLALEGARYAAVGIATSGLNWAVFALALAIIPGLHPAIALVVSSLIAMVASYVGYAKFAFRG